MARKSSIDDLSATVKSAAGTASTRARRAARAATSDGAKAFRLARPAAREAFDDFVGQAQRRAAEGEQRAEVFGRSLSRGIASRPGVAIVALAATAAVAASLVGWALTRKS